MKNFSFILSSTFLLFSLAITAQEQPPIEIFTSRDYGAETQNWSISQSKENYLYVANNNGLLEFNGASWKLYKSPNETIMRSVSVIDGLIYTGCNNEFGYWQRNNFGQLVYTSLSKALKVDFLDDEEFWNIISFDDHVLFQSFNRIYIYNKTSTSISIIDSETIIYKMFKVDETIYYQQTGIGVFKIENGKSKLVSDDFILKENRLVNIFSQNNNLLIETENNGFYVLENGTLKKWDIPANKELSEFSVFRSIKLKDQSFILGTRSNGIMSLSAEGKINYKLNVGNGLGNNTVHWVFEDAESNIWLALENGIICINLNSPFSLYNDKMGNLGTVFTSAVFNDNLYLGTNQGLFYKPLTVDGGFNLVEGIKEAVWSLSVIDNRLFCGHDTGTSIINHKAKKIEGIPQGTWDIKPIKKTNLLLQGNYDGLYVLQKINEEYVLRNKIQGIDLSSKFFEIYNNHIFVSHEYKGVFKIKVDDDFTKVLKIERDASINKVSASSIVTYGKDLLFAYKDGVLKYDSKKNEFIKDSILSKLYKPEDYTSGKLIFNEVNRTLWSFSKKNISYIAPSNLSNNLKIERIPFSKSLPKGLTGYENISHLKEQKHLIGTSNGYVVIDLDKVNLKQSNVTINSISAHSINESPIFLSKEGKGFLKNKVNNFEFTCSVAEFEKYLDTEYQYQLEGLYPNWSDWSTNSTMYFENLPYSNYTFNVRTRLGNVMSKNVASYSFNIEKPWYITNTMVTTYVLLVLLFSLLMHTIYKRYYRKQRENLLQKTNRELELKALENKQQLMRFNNENLKQDIENKNRELGISTMSLIKKNEFLNTIKKELQRINDNKNIKQVIKIIDKNLNNTDDWNVFEEAFNNADKDFLKKIKSLHPELTSNDLRLCAYLRLNLSSKEIAPLLNISPRSVEVKRYRLRKKINLEHESNLSDYILEI